MSTQTSPQALYRFGSYELDGRTRELRKGGMRIRCQDQPLQVLLLLLERAGEIVTREELRARVWPEDTFVDFDHALNTAVKKIRASLNDDADSPRYIETIPRQGYRFIAPVQSERTIVAASSEATSSEQSGAMPSRALWSGRSAQNYWRIAALACLTAGVVGSFYYWGSRQRTRANGTNVRSRSMVAVLPFENMTNDPSQEFFSDGMTEEAIAQLGRLNVHQFSVIARTSAMKYKHSGKSVAEIARELNADYLVEGSIRREGSRVRVAAQLIRATDQSPQWSHEFDYEFGEPLYIETDAAAEIAMQVEKVLAPSVDNKAQRDDTTDIYLRGLAESNIHSLEGLQKILVAFDEGIKKDPDCSIPYAELAGVYERGANLGFLKPTEAYAKATEAANKAIAISPSNPEAHIYLADAKLTIDYDWAGAQTEIQKALALNANDPNAHEWNGLFLFLQGRTDQALDELRTAIDLDPLNVESLVTLGEVLMQAERPVEAQNRLQAAIDLDPASTSAHKALAWVHESQKHYDDAVREWTSYYFLRGRHEQALQFQEIYKKSGYDAAKHYRLREEIAYLTERSKTRFVSPYSIASLHAQLGEKEETLHWLEVAYQERDVILPSIRCWQDSVFAATKNEPRFQAIVNNLHIPAQPAALSMKNGK